MVLKKAGIIGLGLIGGSVARALRYRLGIKDVVAVDRSLETINTAVNDGVLSSGSLETGDLLLDCDIIFICTPVKSVIHHIDALASKVKEGCIITDVASTKGEILEYINGMDKAPCFIGGHPMAGSEKSGYLSGSAHMFENAYYIICPSKTSSPDSLAVLTEIVSGFGAIPVTMDSREHDRITGSISHLPHVVASALVNLVRDTDSPASQMQMLAAGGFKDITRIASSSPEMWQSIVMSNKLQIASILDRYMEKLNEFKHQLYADDSKGIYEFFQSSKLYRDSFSNTRKGLIPSVYELIVDVADKPGIIGEIATLLGSRGINIKNMNISNSREFELGCLRITLQDEESLQLSLSLLKTAGYSASRCC